MTQPLSPSSERLEPPVVRTVHDELSWLEQALALAEAAVYEWDVEQGSIHWAPNAAKILGFESNEILADPERLSAHILPEHRRQVRKQRDALLECNHRHAQQYRFAYEMKLPDGSIFPVLETGKTVRDTSGRLQKLIGMITPAPHVRVQANGALKTSGSTLEDEYAYPRHFTQALHRCMEHYPEHGAVVLISVDNMPMIVNAYGHTEAEHVLRMVRDDILGHANPHTDRLYRIQRDQFALLRAHLPAAEIPIFSRKLQDSLKRLGTKVNNGQSLHIVPTIGTAHFAEVEMIEGLEAQANAAVDKAYVRLKSNAVFTLNMDVPETVYASQEASREQMEVASFLHRAIHQEKIRLAYQPVVKATTGEVSHYECLLRLVNEDGSISSAGAMIPVAERMGLIDVIDHLVLEMVVEDLLRSPDVHLAFNVSNLTTNNHEWLETFVRVIESTPEIANRLIIEITETAAQLDMRATAYFVATVQALGCRVALDDFGSGYTSFRQLKALSCDMVKIDGSFIKDMDASEDSQFFVRTLLEFINGFGLEAVAECVETGECAKALMDLGIHYMQGYYFGRGVLEREWLK